MRLDTDRACADFGVVNTSYKGWLWESPIHKHASAAGTGFRRVIYDEIHDLIEVGGSGVAGVSSPQASRFAQADDRALARHLFACKNAVAGGAALD